MQRPATLPVYGPALPRRAPVLVASDAARPTRVLEVQRVPTQLSLFGRPAPARPGRPRTD
jgi:hypothetical protein